MVNELSVAYNCGEILDSQDDTIEIILLTLAVIRNKIFVGQLLLELLRFSGKEFMQLNPHFILVVFNNVFPGHGIANENLMAESNIIPGYSKYLCAI